MWTIIAFIVVAIVACTVLVRLGSDIVVSAPREEETSYEYSTPRQHPICFFDDD